MFAMPSEPIQVWNPYTSKIEEETIYGEGFLRFAYENPVGRCMLWAFVKRALFSKWYGWRMDQPASAQKVDPFIRDYGIEMSEYLEPEGGFAHFNEFFYRKLAPGARPIAGGSAIFPADGRHIAIPVIGEESWVYAKGHRFRLETLLAGTAYEKLWQGGSALISRLCPVDYHRFHAPVSGRCVHVQDLDGPLFSVSPIALRRRLDYLLSNKRRLVVFETEAMGRVAVIPLGATCVGSIETSVECGQEVEKGADIGYFRFGGSCVITLFEAGMLDFRSEFENAHSRDMELYERMGNSLS